MLERLDLKILAELNKNPRSPCSAIAKRVGSSKETVNYRIRRMISKKIITQFTTSFGLGYQAYKTVIQLKNTSPEEEEEIIRFLAQHPNINWVTPCSGNWDVIFAIMAKDTIQFNAILREITNRIDKALEDYAFSIDIMPRIYGHTYILKNINEDKAIDQKNIMLDEKDKKILRILHTDARAKIVDISGTTEIPADTIKYRIRRMEKEGIIRRYRVIIDRTLLGYHRYEIFIRCINLSKSVLAKFEEYAKQNPNISFFSLCAGSWDIEFTVNLKDNHELRDFIVEVKKQFGDQIKTVESLTLFNTLNFSYYPEELK
ncbi:MAG: Lrp/AsnC family transcriptional regulator [Candidatus Woesearchaeota archaeon]